MTTKTEDAGANTETSTETTATTTKAKKPAKSKKSARGKKPAAKKSTRVPADTKFAKVANWENPFREGSGSRERTELVRGAAGAGKTREQIHAACGKKIKPSTIRNVLKLGGLRVA